VAAIFLENIFVSSYFDRIAVPVADTNVDELLKKKPSKLVHLFVYKPKF
jgi:hypothetical protein